MDDASLASLEPLTELNELDLCNDKITNAGMAHVKRLPKLTDLHLSHTKVTDAGVADLKQARPELQVDVE